MQSDKEGHYGLALMYLLKSLMNVASGAYSFLTAFSYFKPVLDMIVVKAPGGFAGRMVVYVGTKVGGWAAKMFIARALLMVGGLYINLGIIAIQFVIYCMTDDELQEWCDQCAFGKFGNKRHLNPTSQMLHYEKSLAEVV